MKTGDIKNNVRTLQLLIQQSGFQYPVDYASIAKGIPTAFLPVFHYLLAEYSVELSKYLLDNGFEFFSKNDLRFVEETYKLLRRVFNYKSAISVDQFFTIGFSERKIILACDLIRICMNKSKELTRSQKKHLKRQVKAGDRYRESVNKGKELETDEAINRQRHLNNLYLQNQNLIRPVKLPIRKNIGAASNQNDGSKQIMIAAKTEGSAHSTYPNPGISDVILPDGDATNYSLQSHKIHEHEKDEIYPGHIHHGQNRNSHFIEKIVVEEGPKAFADTATEDEFEECNNSDELLKIASDEDKTGSDSVTLDEKSDNQESFMVSQLLADRFAALCNEHIQRATKDLRSDMDALEAKYNNLEQTLTNRIFLLENRVGLAEEMVKELHKEINDQSSLKTNTELSCNDVKHQQSWSDSTEYFKNLESLDGILDSLRHQIGETKILVDHKLKNREESD